MIDLAKSARRAESMERTRAEEEAVAAEFEAKGRADYEAFAWSPPGEFTTDERDSWWRGHNAGVVAHGGRLARRT